MALLAEERVALAPGTTFGQTGAGAVRLTLASAQEQIPEGIRRLGDFVVRRAAAIG